MIKSQKEVPESLPLTGLLSFRLRRLANLMSTDAAEKYREAFDVSLPEWRTLGLLSTQGTLTLNRLARRAAIDKAQMSRVVSGLHERGLVTKSPGARRSSHISLSKDGTALHDKILRAANTRNSAFLAVLTDEEAQVLDRVLDKLTEYAEHSLQVEN